MGTYERNRGASFEREIATFLSDRLGQVVKRKLGQARDAGDDIAVGPFRIECKRRGRLQFYKWLEQCEAATMNDAEQIPVVVARADAKAAVAILLLEDFVKLMRETLV